MPRPARSAGSSKRWATLFEAWRTGRASRASARGCSLARAHGCSRSTRRPASSRWSSVRAASSRWGSAMQSPPSIYKDALIAPQTSPVIRAWNVRTGAALWTFHLVAQPGDPNHKTWENDAWKTIGGTNTWGFLSADIERGIVYIPVSIAGSDYVGVERPGDNLYGTSLVAVDIATGQRKWHQQFVHHDIWDFDLAAAPTVFDAVKDGKTIPAVAEVTKMGMLFMFDRVTGEPLFGMEERPVPQGTVPGEKTSPTQPFPLKPPPLARISLKKSELPTSISPDLTAYCAG